MPQPTSLQPNPIYIIDIWSNKYLIVVMTSCIQCIRFAEMTYSFFNCLKNCFFREKTKIIIDTNIIYKLFDGSKKEKREINKIIRSENAFLSRVSVIEWIIKNAHKDKGNIFKLKSGLKIIKNKKITLLDSAFIDISDEEIEIFINAKNLQSIEKKYDEIRNRRINVESEWISFILYITLGAYISDIGSQLLNKNPSLSSSISRLSQALLNANIEDIRSIINNSIIDGYASDDVLRTVKNSINEIRVGFLTASRIMFEELNGLNPGGNDIKKILQTLDLEKFRKFVVSSNKNGHFEKFLEDFRSMFPFSNSEGGMAMKYLLQALESPVKKGGNINKNDINDSFIVSNLFNPEYKIFTFDKNMKKNLGELNLPIYHRKNGVIKCLCNRILVLIQKIVA